MQLIFKEHKIRFDEDCSVEIIIEKINDLLEEKYYFSHFVADGEEVFEEAKSYLDDQWKQINRLEIIAKSVQEFVIDLLLEGNSYVKRAKVEMKSLAEAFYNLPSSETWTNFTYMLDGIQWLNQVITLIDGVKVSPENFNEYLKLSSHLDVEVKSLGEAVGNKDTILIADIIQYELIPIYEALEKEIQTTLDSEGYPQYAN